MSDIVSPLLQWLNLHPQFAGLVTFIISAAESVAIIGTIVPGSITMTALGALAGAGVIPLWGTIFWAIMGAIVGDGISYWIGHHFKDRLPSIWPFRSNPTILKTGEKFFHKHGSMSVFIGRFVGPVRALVPLVAGMLGMKPLQFFIANVASAIGWAPAYMLPGILLGAASLELPPDIAIHIILVLLMIGLFTLLCAWFLYKFLQLIHNQINQMLDWIWRGMKDHSYLKPLTLLLRHHNTHKTHGQLNLAIYFLIASALFCSLVIYVKFVGASSIMVNDAMFHLFRGIGNEATDEVMLYITLLGQKQVVLPIVLVIFAWLITWKRWRTAFHALGLAILGAGSVFVMKNLIKAPRPWGIFQSPETYSMPSGHATLSMIFFMGLAFLVAQSIRNHKHRWPVYTIGIILTVAVGISRLYLGAHWFTDVLASWFLSAAILIIVIISYQRKMEKPVYPFGILIITTITLAVSVMFFAHRNLDQLKINYAQINWPSSETAMNAYWEKNESLPAYRSSLFGFPSQEINIEWVGELNQIKHSLSNAGWIKPPARDLISTLHRVADISSTEYLPLVSTQYLDKKPALILARNVEGEKGLLFIRLWDSNIKIKENQMPLWVGVVGFIPRSYSWLYRSRVTQMEIDPTVLFPTAQTDWQGKIMKMNLNAGTKKAVKQKILLLRPNKKK